MATCAISTSAQSNLCSRCWCLEQPVLITPMRRQPVLGCAGGNPCRFDRATCAHNTSMRRQPVLGCVYGNLCRFDFCAEQPVLSLLVLRATCAHTPMRRQPVLGGACGNLCRFDLCAEQPVLWLLVLKATCAHNPMRRRPVLGCVYGNLCRFGFCTEQPVLWLLVLRATCANNTYAPATCARLCLWQPVPLRPLRRAPCALAAGA